jgi:hypothetical protein
MPSVYLETTIPSYLAAHPSRDLVMAAHQQIKHGVPARFKICSLLHVTAVEPLNPTASGTR